MLASMKDLLRKLQIRPAMMGRVLNDRLRVLAAFPAEQVSTFLQLTKRYPPKYSDFNQASESDMSSTVGPLNSFASSRDESMGQIAYSPLEVINI